MSLPGFAAEASLYEIRATYRTASKRPGLTGGAIVAQAISMRATEFVCTPDRKACACSGAGDCLECERTAGACKGKHCNCTPTACACV